MSTQISPTFSRRGCDGLAQIGLNRFDVTGTRFFSGEAGAAGAGAAGGDAAPAAAAATQTTEQQTQTESKPPWGDDPSKFDPDKAWRLIENLRTEAAERQAKTDAAIAAAAEKAQKDTLAQFARLLTGEQEPETDPVKLNESLNGLKGDLTKAQEAEKAAAAALKVAVIGAQLGANIPALLADEEFKSTLASVDPTKDAAVKAAITKALQDNAALKQPPARSGTGDHTGPTIQSLESQLKAAQEKKDLVETIRLKQAISAMRQAQSQ